MRIVNNQPVSKSLRFGPGAVFAIALGLMPLAGNHGARAADTAMPSMPPISSPGMPAPSANMATASASPGTDGIPVGMFPAHMPPSPASPPGSELSKNASTLENKASDSAKSIVKRLDSAGDSLTLEDLNSARQTVARLEAMIDVEKHLVELDKIHNERTGESHSAPLSSAIPASALAPMPVNVAPVMPHIEPVSMPRVPEKPKSNWSNLEISRISGVEGKYSAVLKMSDGELKSVRTGDQIGDHMTVRWITSSTVLVEENGETHTLRIKGVDAIYNAMR